MRIALVLTPLTDSHLKLAKQVGVTDIVGRYPGPRREDMFAMRDKVASHGLRLSVVEGYIPIDQIIHGGAKRDEQIAMFQQMLRHMGEAGVSIVSYHFMPDGDWSRTAVDAPERGGALTTAFDAEAVKHERAASGPISEARLWENLERFLKAVVPVAEQSGVKMAMHPDDPPMSPLRGQDRIIRNVEAF